MGIRIEKNRGVARGMSVNPSSGTYPAAPPVTEGLREIRVDEKMGILHPFNISQNFAEIRFWSDWKEEN